MFLTMLGDLAVFWLYVTLIRSFLHLHYITFTRHRKPRPMPHCMVLPTTNLMALFQRHCLSILKASQHYL